MSPTSHATAAKTKSPSQIVSFQVAQPSTVHTPQLLCLISSYHTSLLTLTIVATPIPLLPALNTLRQHLFGIDHTQAGLWSSKLLIPQGFHFRSRWFAVWCVTSRGRWSAAALPTGCAPIVADR